MNLSFRIYYNLFQRIRIDFNINPASAPCTYAHTHALAHITVPAPQAWYIKHKLQEQLNLGKTKSETDSRTSQRPEDGDQMLNRLKFTYTYTRILCIHIYIYIYIYSDLYV